MAKGYIHYRSLDDEIKIDIVYSPHVGYLRTANTYSVKFIKSNLAFEMLGIQWQVYKNELKL